MKRAEMKPTHFQDNDIVAASNTPLYLTLANLGNGINDDGTISFNGGAEEKLSNYTDAKLRNVILSNLYVKGSTMSMLKLGNTKVYADSSTKLPLSDFNTIDDEDDASLSIYNGNYIWDEAKYYFVKYIQ